MGLSARREGTASEQITILDAALSALTGRWTDTCGLEVERYQLGPTEPHGQGVIVGGVQSLASGVDPGQLQTVVLQKLLSLDLVDVLLRLGLGER